MKAALLISAALALGLAGAAHADDPTAKTPAAKARTSCFFSRNWDGWRSPDEKTIYLRVNVRDIWRVDLSFGSQLLAWSDSHLIQEVRGTDSICGPIDLDLKIANDHFVEPLFVKAITRLTPEEVAAIPKKYLP